MQKTNKNLIYKSPLSHQLKGFGTFAFSAIIFYIWYFVRPEKEGFQQTILLTGVIFSFLLALYQILTHTTISFKKNQSICYISTSHFGLFRQNHQETLNHIGIYLDDYMWAKWAVYIQDIPKKASPILNKEQNLRRKEKEVIPIGTVLFKHLKKEIAEDICQEIQEFCNLKITKEDGTKHLCEDY